MRCFNCLYFVGFLLLVPLLNISVVSAGEVTYEGIGRQVTEEDLKAIDTAIGPSGKELPPGSGTVAQGKEIYALLCTHCHGKTGREGPGLALAAGASPGVIGFPIIVWPYATSVWDFINRAMPLDNAGSLTTDQVYALTAFLLYINNIIGEDYLLNAKNLPAITMPSRDNYFPKELEWKPGERRKFGLYNLYPELERFQ